MWYELIQFSNMSWHEMKTWWNTLKFEQTAERIFRQSDSLDRFEQVERSKSHTGEVQKLSPFFIINLLHNIMKSQINDANWYDSTNMLRLVWNSKNSDANWYDSTNLLTCYYLYWNSKTSDANWYNSTIMLRLAIHQIWCDLIGFHKHVQTCFKNLMWFDRILQTCSDLF